MARERLHVTGVLERLRWGGVLAFVLTLLLGDSSSWGQRLPSDGSSGAERVVDVEQWFRDEYPEALKNLAKPIDNIEVEGRHSERYARMTADEIQQLAIQRPVAWRDVADTSEVNRDFDFTFRVKGGLVAAEMDFASYENPEWRSAKEVLCTTEENTFVLEMPRAKTEYLICQHTDEPKALRKNQLISQVTVMRESCAAYVMCDVPVSDLLDEEECRIVKAELLARDSGDTGQLVQIEFRALGDSYYESGRVVLDPAIGWAITEYEVREPNPGSVRTIHGQVSYKPWIDEDLVFPRSLLRDMRYDKKDGGVYLRRETTLFNHASTGGVEDHEFALSAFGLPDLPASGMAATSSLAVEASCIDTGPLAVHEETEIRYVFCNKGRTSIRLIGAEGSCGPNGCNQVRGLPLTLPKGSRQCIVVDFQAPSAGGRFSKQFGVYTDCASQPRVNLEIRGLVYPNAAGEQ